MGIIVSGMNPVNVYGTDWCEDTQHTREHLDELGIPYSYINIERDAGAASWVKRQNQGKQKTPTVDVEGLVLSVPSDDELDSVLRSEGLLG